MKNKSKKQEKKQAVRKADVSSSATRPPLGLIPKKIHDERVKYELTCREFKKNTLNIMNHQKDITMFAMIVCHSKMAYSFQIFAFHIFAGNLNNIIKK
jgi:hypothetical protein